MGYAVGTPDTKTYGHPILRYANNGVAYWCRGNALSQLQKGSGWAACLYGGVQTGDDWAAVYVPVNEVPLADFKRALWSWYQTNTESMGLGIVIWVHDPEDNDKRAEISQVGGVTGLDKSAGWNSHELSLSTTQFFFYGENTTGTDLTAGTQYTLAQFKADALFKGWTIYRISLEWGWESSGTFEAVYVADFKINGELVLLNPKQEDLVPVKQYATATTGALANTLAPKTPYKLISIDLTINTAGTTNEAFTITQDAILGTAFDRLILTQNTLNPAITSLFVPFGDNYVYDADDELDAAWPNTENRTYGLVWTWQPV
jgi:hypothetical protein